MQNAIVAVMVLVAVLYVARLLLRMFSGKESSCGCGKNSCSKLGNIPKAKAPTADDEPAPHRESD